MLVVAVLTSRAAIADDADTNETSGPILLMVHPFVIPGGETANITLRGRHLVADPRIFVAGTGEPLPARIVDQGSAEAPDKFDAERVGDQFLEVELETAAGFTGELAIRVQTPAGESVTKSVTVLPPERLANEHEPNDSLAEPQPLEWGQTVRGSIHQNQDVDVYRMFVHEGHSVKITATADSRDSLCDPMLMIFDQDGRLLSLCDDVEDSTDPAVTLVPAESGELLIAVMDSHDLGGPLHCYTLRVDEIE